MNSKAEMGDNQVVKSAIESMLALKARADMVAVKAF
jgi:hypothetical protein